MNTNLIDFGELDIFGPDHHYSKARAASLALGDLSDEVFRVFDEVELLSDDLRLIVNGEGLRGSEVDLLLGGHSRAFLLDAYMNACSLVLLGADRFSPLLKQMNDDLHRLTGRSTHVNCYLNPAHAPGAKRHSDDHDVVALQLFGKKFWSIGADVGSTTITLEPGAALFLPRGVEHEVSTKDDASLHVTFGIGSEATISLKAHTSYKPVQRWAATPTLRQINQICTEESTEIRVLADGDTCAEQLLRYWAELQRSEPLLFAHYLKGSSRRNVQILFDVGSPLSSQARLRAKKMLVSVGCAEVAVNRLGTSRRNA